MLEKHIYPKFSQFIVGEMTKFVSYHQGFRQFVL
jgi:hypothetical protein